MASGGLIAIYGAGLSIQSAATPVVPLPTTLAGAQVILGNQLLPLLYVSPGQVNAMVPYNAPLNVPLQLTVIQAAYSSPPETVIVAPTQPAVFLLPQIAPNRAAIVGPGGLVSPQAPVTAGDTIVIYCAGLGPVAPAVEAGTAASLTTLSFTANPVSVKIGGKPAAVSFAGLAPGFVGGYQVNVVVPAGVAGDDVPVVLEVAAQTSPAVVISVR